MKSELCMAWDLLCKIMLSLNVSAKNIQKPTTYIHRKPVYNGILGNIHIKNGINQSINWVFKDNGNYVLNVKWGVIFF